MIKARSVVMPGGGEPPAGEAGFSVLLGRERTAARWWLDTAPLRHVMQRRMRAQLEKAEREAAGIVAAARMEADAIRAQAREEGYQAGLAAGQEAGAQAARAELEQTLHALRAAVAELARAAAAAAERHEDEIVQLALAVVARLSRRTDVLGPETVRAVLREMLPRAAGTQEVTVRLHPEDLEALQGVTGELSGLVNGGTHVAWVADERVARGGCVVDTDRGQLDARVETRLGRLADSLWEVVRVVQ
ncbi:MAG TPA: FliH/SctL family protein [Limnochordales bacterium]